MTKEWSGLKELLKRSYDNRPVANTSVESTVRAVMERLSKSETEESNDFIWGWLFSSGLTAAVSLVILSAVGAKPAEDYAVIQTSDLGDYSLVEDS